MASDVGERERESVREWKNHAHETRKTGLIGGVYTCIRAIQNGWEEGEAGQQEVRGCC